MSLGILDILLSRTKLSSLSPPPQLQPSHRNQAQPQPAAHSLSGRRRVSEKIRPRMPSVELAVGGGERASRSSRGQGDTSPCQLLFYDVTLQRGSGTWHIQGEHTVGFEKGGSVTLRGSDRNSSALLFDTRHCGSGCQMLEKHVGSAADMQKVLYKSIHALLT
ncbi:hypothetical protein CRENBAI_020886 [Crenichthys baileyi]|uniref:Uncharacterized protein n=1 Tax=Crenichthys baileyi TaxID=28760 RepID=A0AAV9S3H7_9TELE